MEFELKTQAAANGEQKDIIVLGQDFLFFILLFLYLNYIKIVQ